MQRYTDTDICEWDQSIKRILDSLLPKLGIRDSQPKQDHVLSVLSITYVDLAQCEIARGRYEAARQALEQACNLIKTLFELAYSGYPMRPRTLSTGYFQYLLHAFAASRPDLALLLSRLLRTEHHGPADSTYFCGLLKSIIEVDSNTTASWLSQPVPSVDIMFTGYAECIGTMVPRNEMGFTSALQSATDAWEKHSFELDEGSPGVVCFLGGVGLVNLARYLGMKVNFEDERLPVPLFYACA